jgi:hypothetical protein
MRSDPIIDSDPIRESDPMCGLDRGRRWRVD